MIPGLYYTEGMFPLFGQDQEFVDRALAATKADLAPVVASTLLGRADEVSRMLRARNRE